MHDFPAPHPVNFASTPSSIKRFVTTLFVVCAVVLCALSAPSWAKEISAQDAKTARAVFEALDKNRFKDAKRLTAKIKNTDLERVLRWEYLVARRSPAKFDELAPFLARHDQWPKRKTMLRRAEETMDAKTSARDVLDWLEEMGGPVSTMGRMRKGEALLQLGRTDEALAVLREVWINGNFTKSQEKTFYRRHKKHLTRADNEARLERLIWQERFWPARRQIWKVDEKIRKVAVARLWLQRREGNVDKAIADVAKVAPEFIDHPGLVYERLRWRRRKGRTDSAAELFAKAAGDLGRPDKWWTERLIITRTLLHNAKAKRAYEIASGHGLSPDNPADYSDAEWLSGWIALNFLGDPNRALKHFKKMLAVVNYPISVARGAYWTGRAHQALGQTNEANVFLKQAARYPTTYYGQLASARLGIDIPDQRSAPKPNGRVTKAFNAHPMTKAVRLLAELGAQKRMRSYLLHLSDINDAPEWQMLSAHLARDAGRPDLGIRIAKASERVGAPLGQVSYPRLNPPRPKGGETVETALVLAVIRQESAFYPGARSSAGARGMMQVMPSTAKRVARGARLPYDRARLLQDADYNMVIGQIYLASMVKEFDGSYPMALAAYNAGPHRVKRWIRTFGDPRKGDIHIIDWVEMIPYSETRNYVQRVLGNLGVYRKR